MTTTMTRSAQLRSTPARTSPAGTAPNRASSARTAPPAGGELRLTRRGRLVVVLVFLTVLMGAVLALSGYSAASDARGPAQPMRTVVVEEGDTLWEIAARVAEPGEVREVVHELQELNALAGPELVEGQRIALPAR
jgi:Tfp pilus assembly protein FimV